MTGNNKVWRAPVAGLASVAMLATLGVSALTANAATALASYKITFVGNGTKNVDAYAGETIADALNGYKTGVAPGSEPGSSEKFVGWLDENGSLVDFDTPVTSDMTLTADVVPAKDAVRIQYTKSSDIDVPLQFPDGTDTAAGYGDYYWYVRQGSSIPAQRTPRDIGGDQKLVLSWNAEGATVTDLTQVNNVTETEGFDITPETVTSNAGTLVIQASGVGFVTGALSDGEGSYNYAVDTAATSASVPSFVSTTTKPQQIVTSWMDTTDTSKIYKAGDTVSLAAGKATTLKAKDISKAWTVTFKANGKVVSSLSVADEGFVTDANIPADPTKEGFSFKGWKNAGTGDIYTVENDKFNTVPVKGDTTFEAVFDNKTTLVEVTFKDENYAGNNDDVKITVAGGSFIDPADVPQWERKGYVFAGWKLADGTMIDFDTFQIQDNQANFTLTASWTKATIDLASAALKYVQVGLDDSEYSGDDSDYFTKDSFAEYKDAYLKAYQEYKNVQYTSDDVSAEASAKIVNELNAAWKKLEFKHNTGIASKVGSSIVHRLSKGNEHFYTADENEVLYLSNVLTTGANWTDEGRLFEALRTDAFSDFSNTSDDENTVEQLSAAADPIVKPVYRLYNTVNGDHVWTVDRNEHQVLASTAGWNDEGEAFYVPAFTGTQSVVRLSASNRHLLSTDTNEQNVLGKAGWNVEGEAFKGI